jgi:glycosyltransferase involved in cell wall biosynthesis
MQALNSPRILFISTLRAPFIQDDLEFLMRLYQVRCWIGSGVFQVFRIILACLKSDIAFCWFGSTYAFIAVLMMRMIHRRSIIVIGGVDVAKDEKLGYGIWLVPWKAALIRYAFRHADKIIAVDESLAEKARHLADYNGKNIEIVPTGYDTSFWKIIEGMKTNCVLTVAAISDEKRFCIKGLDILFEVARLLPQITFSVIGVTKEIASKFNAPPNIEVLPKMERMHLLPYYQQAKIYCQPSRYEGMPNVLCEAMLCGCIPVATNVGATKSILNEIGTIVPADNISSLASAIQIGLQLPDETKHEVRKQIVFRFTKKQREEKLKQILQALYQ